jgi:hypothetical protein
MGSVIQQELRKQRRRAGRLQAERTTVRDDLTAYIQLMAGDQAGDLNVLRNARQHVITFEGALRKLPQGVYNNEPVLNVDLDALEIGAHDEPLRACLQEACTAVVDAAKTTRKGSSLRNTLSAVRRVQAYVDDTTAPLGAAVHKLPELSVEGGHLVKLETLMQEHGLTFSTRNQTAVAWASFEAYVQEQERSFHDVFTYVDFWEAKPSYKALMQSALALLRPIDENLPTAAMLKIAAKPLKVDRAKLQVKAMPPKVRTAIRVLVDVVGDARNVSGLTWHWVERPHDALIGLSDKKWKMVRAFEDPKMAQITPDGYYPQSFKLHRALTLLETWCCAVHERPVEPTDLILVDLEGAALSLEAVKACTKEPLGMFNEGATLQGYRLTNRNRIVAEVEAENPHVGDVWDAGGVPEERADMDADVDRRVQDLPKELGRTKLIAMLRG